MAKIHVGTGIDNYIKDLQNLEHKAPEAIGAAIYKGAGIITDEIRKNINALPKSVAPDLAKKGLLDGLGISRQGNDSGFINVKAGFAGYNEHYTKKYPAGHPNAMIARSIEGGTSWMPKHPFVAPAIRSKKEEAEKTMADVIDKYLKENMEG